MSQQLPSVPQPPPERSYLKQYKNLIVTIAIILTIIIVVVILLSPIIPIQYTVPETRTRSLLYNAGMYFNTVLGIKTYPPFVNVTNEDSVSGSFSVTIDYWYNSPFSQSQLVNTFSQSVFINAGTTQIFSPPKGWGGTDLFFWSYSYSVSTPTTQETYNVTKTEYKSILNLVSG